MPADVMWILAKHGVTLERFDGITPLLRMNVKFGAHLRFGVFGFLVHDVKDHTAGCRAALRSRVDADGLFCGPGVLFTVDVNPEKGINR